MKQVWVLSVVFATLSGFALSSYNDNKLHVDAPCPCSDPKYCERITAPDRQEVFAYIVNLTYYKQYDWKKLTTVVIGYAGALEEFGMEFVCLAHKYNTRVLMPTVISAEQLVNATARTEVVEHYFNLAQKYYMDGANIDVELMLTTPELQNGLTEYVKATNKKWKAAYPHSLVAVDVWWVPNIYHDPWSYANHSDFLFVMSYDEQADMVKPCVARANAPFAQTQFGIIMFKALGIPGHKLVLGLPWYGYNYQCLTLTEKNLCYIKEDGGHCSETAGTEVDYKDILKILPNSMGGRQWSDVYDSPFVNFKDSSGAIHQIWYDDAMSLKPKYALAEKYQLRGVGVWHADALDYANTTDPTTKEMWDALPSYK